MRRHIAFLAVIALAGCSDSDADKPDAGAGHDVLLFQDVSFHDALNSQDGSLHDGAKQDDLGASPDAPAVDGSAVDGSAVDGSVADAALTDAPVTVDTVAIADSSAVDLPPAADLTTGGLCQWSAGWHSVGGALSAISGAGTDAQGVNAVIGPTGRPVVAWSERTGTGNERPIYVRRWNGAAWQALGGALSASAGKDTKNSAVLGSGAGELYIAWAELDSASNQVRPHVRRWTGSNWVAVGSALGSGPMNAFEMDILVDSLGKPIVAWSQYDGVRNNIHVARWTGSKWVAMGGALNNHSVDATWPSLGGPTAPTLVWQEAGQAIQISVWSGTTWSPWGGPLGGQVSTNIGDPAYSPVLASKTGGSYPSVAYAQRENGVMMGYMAGGMLHGWWKLGTDLSGEPDATDSRIDDMVVDGSNYSVVAWNEANSAGEKRVYVYRYDSSVWTFVQLGIRNAVSGGNAGPPNLAADNCDQIFVAWDEPSGGSRQVFVHVYR